MTVRAQTLAALDGEWRSALEIHRRIDMWSKTTIKHELRLLALAGEIEEKRVPHRGGSGEKALFRRKSE